LSTRYGVGETQGGGVQTQPGPERRDEWKKKVVIKTLACLKFWKFLPIIDLVDSFVEEGFVHVTEMKPEPC
jgi:hypothetical protein